MRAAAAIVLAFACAAGTSALDFGLTLSNDSVASYEDAASLDQSNRARAWVSQLFGRDSILHVSGFYEFHGNFLPSSGSINPVRFDLDRADFETSIASPLGPDSMLRLAIGRAVFGDFSSRVLTGLSDGARAELSIGGIVLQAAGGYRGLLYKQDARSVIDTADQVLRDDATAYFAPRRAFAGLGLRVIELFGSYDLGLEAWGQADLRGSGRPTHTGYLEPYMIGRITRSLGLQLWGVYEVGYDDAVFASAAAGSQIDFSVPELLGLRLSQKLLWASGGRAGLRAFTPIRLGTLGAVSALPFSDAISASLEAFVSPVRGVYAGLSSEALFRASDKAPSNGAVRTDASGPYLGFESNLLIAFQPALDLSLSAGFGVFVPNTTTLYTGDTPNKLSASLSATFSP